MAAGNNPADRCRIPRRKKMKLSKILGLAAVVALALMALASTASATTLETSGVKQTGAVTLNLSLAGSATLSTTAGTFFSTCNVATMSGTTTAFTGTPSGPLSTLSVSKCTHESVVVDNPGTLSVTRIGTTTNGTVFSTGLDMTVPVPNGFGGTVTVTCSTSNTDIGTLNGSNTAATMTTNAVITCSGILPTAKWTGTYALTTSGGAKHGIGVVE
jgi:hypothetical protein